MATRYTINDMKDIARHHGGKLLSKKNINANIPVEWQCDKGHRWMAGAGSVKFGTWCPVCAIEKRKTTMKIRARKSIK